MRFEVIKGGAVKLLPVLNAAVKQSIATRFLVHGAKLSTLAWETHAATEAKLRKAERLLYGTLALAGASLVAVVVMVAREVVR